MSSLIKSDGEVSMVTAVWPVSPVEDSVAVIVQARGGRDSGEKGGFPVSEEVIVKEVGRWSRSRR